MTVPDLDQSVVKRLRGQVGASTVERLVELFRENVRERQAAALSADKNENGRELGVAFHSIKGSAQLIGARRLEEIAARWEERARSGEIESIAVALEEIAEAFSRVERALEASTADP